MSIAANDASASEAGPDQGQFTITRTGSTASTVSSGNVNTKYRTVAVPVMNWESALMDDLGMTGTVSGTDSGTQASQTTRSIVNASHPMAAGLSGAPTVATAASAFTWGVPNANAVKIATINGNALWEPPRNGQLRRDDRLPGFGIAGLP